MNRVQILTSMFDPGGFGLEIGPSYNPLVPKSSGARIETIDHADQAGLVRKYRDDPSVDVSRIEPVDYVSDGRPMVEVIGQEGRYDYILASHVIEHTPNMLGFLNDCATLLKDNGTLVLAVPDKRYCFDYFRPTTSTGDIIQAFREKRTRHTAGALFDHFAYVTRRGDAIVWLPRSEAPFDFIHDTAQAADIIGRIDHNEEYIDCHAWQFTASSFRLILSDLHSIGLLSLREQEFHETGEFEFYAALSKNGPGCPLNRLALAEKAQVEGTQIRPARPLVEATAGDLPPAVHAATPPPPSPARAATPMRKMRKALKRMRRSLAGEKAK